MDLQPLYEVKERLERAAVAGTGLLGEDFRLKRALEGLAPLAAASPVFAKIHAGVEALLSAPPEQRGGALLDALALVDAVAYTQAAVGMPGALEPLPPGTGTCQDVSYSQLHPLLEALTGTGGGRMALVQEAFQAHPEYFSDYRVLPALVQGLGDSYGKLAEFNAAILSRQGPGVAPLLEEGFDPAGGRAMARRVEVLAQAAGAQANDFYLTQLPRAKEEVRLALIVALGHSPANAPLLLTLCQTEGKGAGRNLAWRALAQLDTPEVEEALLTLSRKDWWQAVDALSYSDTPLAGRLTAQLFLQELAPFEAQPDTPITAKTQPRLAALSKALDGKAGPEVCQFHRWAADVYPITTYMPTKNGEEEKLLFSHALAPQEGVPFRKLIPLVLTHTLMGRPDPQLCRLSIALQEQYGRDFLAPALAARLILQGPEACYPWAEEQLFPNGPGAQPKEAAVSAFRAVLGNLHWDEEAAVYWFDGLWSPLLRQATHGPVPLPPLDRRWFDLLLQAGDDLYEPLLNLLRGRRDLGLSQAFLAHLYHAAQRMTIYPLEQAIEILGGLGWTDWDGFVVRCLQGEMAWCSYWTVYDVLNRLPVPPEEKLRQLRELTRMWSEDELDVAGGWPRDLVQSYTKRWEKEIRDRGGEAHD